MPHDVIPRGEEDAVMVEQLAYLLCMRQRDELSPDELVRLNRVVILLESAFDDEPPAYLWQAEHQRAIP